MFGEWPYDIYIFAVYFREKQNEACDQGKFRYRNAVPLSHGNTKLCLHSHRRWLGRLSFLPVDGYGSNFHIPGTKYSREQVNTTMKRVLKKYFSVSLTSEIRLFGLSMYISNNFVLNAVVISRDFFTQIFDISNKVSLI